MNKRKIITYLLFMIMSITILVISTSMAFADTTLTGSGTEDDPYQIGTAEEFAAMPEASLGKYFILTDDIEVAVPYASDFQGVFDGDGHTVTLSIESTSAYNGLFGALKGPAAVKNLLVEGSITVEGNKSYTGAIAGTANGFNDGTNDGVTIRNCRNKADISGYKAVGGIVGMTSNGVTITGCGNSGAITGGNTQIGGIVGNAAGGETIITDCYNAGAVTGFNMTGGIIGQATKSSAIDKLTNCYAVGAVTNTSTNTDIGSLLGNKSNSGTISNCYVLNTAAGSAIGGGVTNEGVTSKTSDEMKAAAFVSALGESFVADTKSMNDGYPVLEWETVEDTAPKATVIFNVTPSGAVIKVDKKVISDGMAQVKAGSHSYVITREGYKTVNGTFEVTAAQAEAEETIHLDLITLIALDHITVSGYQESYYKGDELTGLVVKAVYADESEEEVTGYTTDFDSSQPVEDKLVTVTYQGKTATFTVDILARASVLDPISGKMTVNLVTGSYGFEEDTDNGWLITNNQKKSSSTASMTMTAVNAGMFSFKYKVSSESRYDKFTVKKGDETLIDAVSGEIDWTAQSILLAKDDVVTFSYTKDSSTDNGSDSVYIKDLAVESAYTVTFSTTPANADIVMKDSSNNTVSAANGVYTVLNGTYTYTVSAFGYETESGSITVNGENVEKTVTLTQLSSQQLIFNVTVPEGHDPLDVQIELKSGDTVITPIEAGKYNLPAGEYTYTVTHPRCVTAAGSVTVVDRAQTVNVALEHKDSVIDPILDSMNVTLIGGSYGFVDDVSNNWLVTNNQSVNSSTATMTMTAKKGGLFAFKYKVSSEARYDKFTIKKGSQTLVDAVSGDIDWTDMSMLLETGDMVTFTYVKDSSGNSGSDSAYIKDLSMAEAHTVTFSTTPADAEVVLKDSSNNVITGSAGVFTVTDGTYTYTVSAFGYEEKTGTITVNGEDVTETVELTQLSTHKVSFDVDLPDGVDSAGVATEVKYDSTVIDPVAGYYNLPAGDYTYKVTHPECEEVTGTFTVAEEDVTVSVSMRKTLTLADFIDSDIVTAANDTNYPYKGVYDDGGNYLESTHNGNYQFASIILTFSSAAKLSFDYWTQIGASTSYGLTISRGNAVEKRINGSNNWTGYSIDVAAGDKIELKYSRQYNEAADNCVRFKNFVITPMYKLSFSIPEGASVELKSGDEVISGSGTEFDVLNGTYSYTVSKFGYADKEGTVTVNGAAQTVEIALSDLVQLDSRNISFTVAPEGAEVTVTHDTAGVMTPDASGIYSLPVGESFSYSVSKANYITEEGTFTVSEDSTIEVSLTYAGEAWDGETATKPAQGTGSAEDPYLISNAEELAWVMEEVNSGTDDISVKLVENINLNNKSWAGIGNYSTNYAGVFDGNGKTVSGLNGSAGLLQYTGTGSMVKDLTVSGSLIGNGNIGGIVSFCYGTVQNCRFTGSVSNSNSYSTGGIVGNLKSGGKITGCVNNGNVINTCTSYSQSLQTGGIVGYSYGDVENCYNTGKVTADSTRTTNKNVGGLIGQNYGSGTVTNCYNAGTVSGPEDGTYDFAGANAGTITNSYVLNTVGGKATTGVEAKTKEYMSSEAFVIDLGANAFNKDTDDINGGLAILKWQGGSAVSDPSAEDVAEAKNALKLQGKKGEDIFDLELTGEAYVIKPGDVDNLVLPSEGTAETAIAWSTDVDGVINITTGVVTIPETGTQLVNLTAVITKGHASAEKIFQVSVWSEQAVAQDNLNKMAAKLEDTGITASQIVHPEEATISDIVKRALSDSDFDTEDLSVALVSVEGTNNYIGEDGAVTYYKGETEGMNYAIFNRAIKVKLSKGGAESDCTLKQLLLSWDKAYVQNILDGQVSALTWDSFRGDNTNEADFDASVEPPLYTVGGYVTSDLKLPAQIGACSITWTAVQGADHVTIGEMEYGAGSVMYYPCTFAPSADENVAVKLEAALTYNRLNDFDKGDGVASVVSLADYSITLEQNDNPGVDKEKAQKALEEEYPGMIKDFVDKSRTVDINALKDDIQLPTPSDLDDTDIMQDRDNEKVVMTSSNDDVLELYGYHGYVYRPLPGEEDATATLTVSIVNRTNGSVVASKDFTLTVKAFTQQELDDAAADMEAVATEDVYWAGLSLGTSNTKEEVTEHLYTYKEIWKTEDGYEYVKGKDANFSFIALDELPGYDPMGSQKWWTIRSSNEDVITSENLLVTRPEDDDAEVTIDSVMSYVKYANYWERFGVSETATDESKAKYAVFEQFYKVPVSVTVTVTAPHIHQIIHYPAKEPTEEAEGNKEYWKCGSCGKFFADEDGEEEITWDDIVIPKLPHDHVLTHYPAKEATEEAEGNKEYWKCESCGKFFADEDGKEEITWDDIVIQKKDKPSDGGDTPSDGGDTPSDGGDTPSDGGDTPSDGGDTPSDGGDTPSDGGDTPSDGGNTPSDGGNTPSDSGNTPSNGGDTPSDGSTPSDNDNKPAPVDTTFSDGGSTFAVTSDDKAAPEIVLKKGADKAVVAVPDTIVYDGVEYTVTEIAPKAFFKNKKVKKVIVGANIIKIGAKAFSKCKNLKKFTAGKNVSKIGSKCFAASKKLKTLIVKTKKLKKRSVKKALAGSRIKTVKVKVGSKKQNKKFVKKYRKIFTKKNCGRKVRVK